jgi:hypothetical protein
MDDYETSSRELRFYLRKANTVDTIIKITHYSFGLQQQQAYSKSSIKVVSQHKDAM